MSEDFKFVKTLTFGFPGNGDGPIKDVVYGRRLTAADQAAIENDSQSELTTQKNLMMARACMVDHGGKGRAPFLTDLLALKRSDRELVVQGYFEYLVKSQQGFKPEKIDESSFRLAFPLKVGEHVFDGVRLGDKANEITGYEQVEIEREHQGYELTFALLGLGIEEMFQTNGPEKLSGPIEVEVIERFDFFDLGFLMEQDGKRRQRFQRTASQPAKPA